jgi:hypothetical protein
MLTVSTVGDEVRAGTAVPSRLRECWVTD